MRLPPDAKASTTCAERGCANPVPYEVDTCAGCGRQFCILHLYRDRRPGLPWQCRRCLGYE